MTPDKQADAQALKALTLGLMNTGAVAELRSHPAFAQAARATVAGWAPQSGDDRHISRTLQDVGLFMAGLWIMQLDAQPEGVTHGGLAGVLADWGIASRGRIGPMLAYLRFRRLVEPAVSGDRRSQRYQPTLALSELFRHWFERELAACGLVCPEVQPALAAWRQPSVRNRFIVAYGRLMLGAHLAQAELQQQLPEATLDVFSHRRSGLTVLGQLLIAAGFPDDQPVRLNIAAIARRADVSRGHVHSLIRAGERAGFLGRDPAGLTVLNPSLVRHVSDFLPMYWLGLAWAAGEATGETGTSGD